MPVMRFVPLATTIPQRGYNGPCKIRSFVGITSAALGQFWLYDDYYATRTEFIELRSAVQSDQQVFFNNLFFPDGFAVKIITTSLWAAVDYEPCNPDGSPYTREGESVNLVTSQGY